MLSSDTPTAARANMLMACAIALGFLALYLSNLGSVPFHPDESTQIYMSRDFDVAVLERNPAALAWTAGQPLTPEMRLRLLDAPMTKYLFGIGRWLRGFTPAASNVDWVWGATWDENHAAIPANSLLLAARLPTAVLGALVAVLAFGIGAQLGGAWLGVLAALLVGLDPLLLLHARRAMAESALTFFSALAALGTLALVVHGDSLKRLRARTLALGALVGVLAGLAMDSKQTELVMLPVALSASALSVLQRPWTRSRKLASLCALWFAIGLGWALGVWLVNPVLYREPVGTVQTMLALTIPLNWQRYFMPLLAPSRLFAALGMLALARLATRSTAILPALRTRYQRVP